MASTHHKDILEALVAWKKPCYYYLQSKENIELTNAWEHNGISSIIKTYYYVYKEKGHSAYTIRNSMECYPSERFSSISIITWKNPY